jgi:hypothetical protein
MDRLAVHENDQRATTAGDRHGGFTSSGLAAARVLTLQRQAGNRAVVALLRRQTHAGGGGGVTASARRLLARQSDDDLLESAQTYHERERAFLEFWEHNEQRWYRPSGLTEDDADRIYIALTTALWDNLQAQIEFYRHYTDHDLRIGEAEAIFEARTDSSGDTLIRRETLTYDPYRLAGLLVHERFHGRAGQQSADGRTGRPAQEGQSYGVQWYLLNLGGSPSHRGQNAFSAVYSCGGGEIDPGLLPVFREAFRKTVALCEILADRIAHDDPVHSPAGPDADITRHEAREMWLQLQRSFRLSGQLAELYDSLDGSRWTARRTPQVHEVTCVPGQTLPDF